MKTILNKSTNEIKRVKDKESENYVKYGWSYCPKSEWKKLNNKPTNTQENTKAKKGK